MTDVKFVKNSERVLPSYDVFVNGTEVGYVYRTWTRFGGHGWTYRLANGASSRRFDSRKDATKHMVRRHLQLLAAS